MAQQIETSNWNNTQDEYNFDLSSGSSSKSFDFEGLIISNWNSNEKEDQMYKDNNATVELDIHDFIIDYTHEFVNRATYFSDSQSIFHGLTEE